MLTWNKETWKATLSEIDKPTVCTLEFETADNLNGSEPVVKEGLVPVVIADNGVVTKTETDDINWYDYNESKWANAVILTGTDIYGVGEIIPEEAIESYFVWIPKYRYKLFNVEGNNIPEQEIEIKIGDYDTENNNTTECKATNKSGDDGTCKDEMWMTHPAFTSLGVNGIWVGKFETTGIANNITIKPDQPSIINITGSAMYNTSYNYKRGLDSHMMKNTEWGAMVYLTNSKYGRPKDENGVPTEVMINSNENYITGCTNTTTYFDGSVGASTTNNYTGIYDTSGGGLETVMGNLNNNENQFGLSPTNIPDKYIDRYIGDNISYKILGDATAETRGWYKDIAYFLGNGADWFYRGGNMFGGETSGIFYYTHFGGGEGYSFRIVLAPTN